MESNIDSFSLENVGIVVPTLGRRTDYLIQSIDSIKKAGCNNIAVIGPMEQLIQIHQISNFYSKVINDPGHGLPAAINMAINSFPSSIKFVGWLGDDDLLEKDSLVRSINAFKDNDKIVATYGACAYIDDRGNQIFVNNSGKWATTMINFLPNLIPQPGSLFRRTSFETVGGVKSKYPLAFDFELFFELKKIGKIEYISEIQGYFRWHSESLSVNQRERAIKQSSQIRKHYLPKYLRYISVLWEPIICQLTFSIGKIASKKTR